MSVVGVDPAPMADRRRAHDEEELRALVERATTDPDAFASLYRRFLAPVYGFALRRCGAREVAEDITSATFERVWRGLSRFEWRDGGFEPWLFRIAATEVAEHHRRAHRGGGPRGQLLHADRLLAAVVEDHADGGPPTGHGLDADSLRAALAGLRPRYQQAISLRYLSGLSHEQAAEAMGCSKPVMAVTLHRAMAGLRRALGAAPANDRERART